MKKVILFVLAAVGGAMSGILAGVMIGTMFAAPIALISLTLGGEGNMAGLFSNEYFMWWARIVSIIGAIAMPILLKEKVNEWSAG